MIIETDASMYLKYIPVRLSDSNKGTYGKVLLIAGSEGMSGAAYLSALAAYRTGAGLVKFLTHSNNRTILQTLLPEAIFEGYDSTTSFSELLEKNISWADIIVIGPGIGTSDLSIRLMSYALKGISDLWPDKLKKKEPLLIVDADGLNILSTHEDLNEKLHLISTAIPVIITPHPLEMNRLNREPLDDILSDPAKYAASYSKEHNLITILKGPETTVATRDGEKIFKNTKVSPALSKGGSGDVLSGTIAGLYTILRASRRNEGVLISGSKPISDEDVPLLPTEEASSYHANAYISAVLGVIIHGEAGRYAATSHGTHGVLARDTANCLGCVLDRYLYTQDKGNS